MKIVNVKLLAAVKSSAMVALFFKLSERNVWKLASEKMSAMFVYIL